MIIGIDAGYGFTKTVNTAFSSGVALLSYRPAIMKHVIEYNRSFYQVGASKEGIISDKTSNEDNYILTLAAIAEEMRMVNIYEAEIVLAVGVPLMRFGAEKDDLIKYLTKNKEVSFKYEDKEYKCKILNIHVYPQGYAAIVNKLNEIKGPCWLVDMGTGTTELLPINSDKSVDFSRAKTIQFGLTNCISEVNAEISNQYNTTLSTDSIIQIIIGNKDNAGVNDEVFDICENVIKRFAESTLLMLRTNKVNYEISQTFFVGGGAGLIKRFTDLSRLSNIYFYEDIRANAKGYELLAKAEESNYKNV